MTRFSFVKSVEAYVSTYDGRVVQATVELDCGYRYVCPVEDAPRVGDRKRVTVEDDNQESLDLSDMRAAVLDFGSRIS